MVQKFTQHGDCIPEEYGLTVAVVADTAYCLLSITASLSMY